MSLFSFHQEEPPKPAATSLNSGELELANDELYTYERVKMGCPSKWFEKTSNTRVYLKDNVNVKKREIEQNMKKLLVNSEKRRDKFLMREVLRKNIWKYKTRDFNMQSKDDMRGKKDN
jgi:hypothetical protein